MANVIGEPRVVEAGRGAAWWGEGWHILTANFWTWIGMMIIYIVITMLIGLVPFVGTFGNWLLTPVFIGGLMLGCQAIDRDEPLRVAHLFEGFQGAYFVPLMIIGAVNIVLTLIITALAVAGLVGGVSLAGMMQSGVGGDPLSALAGMAEAFTGTGVLLILIAVVIAAIFAMLNWFAPALVALDGATAVQAMKLSFSSSLRNWVPFLIYGLIAIAVGVVAMLVMSLLVFGFGVGTIMALFSGGGTMPGGGLGALIGVGLLFIVATVIFVLVIPPIVFGSQYAGYKDTLAVEEWAHTNIA